MDNQTDPNDLANVSPNDPGIGIFLVPNVQSDQYAAALKVYVPDIKYAECIRRGQFALAFKWVPAAIATVSQLQQSHCSGPCVTSCAGKGCVCNQQRGMCE